jgi:hypothetical protein
MITVRSFTIALAFTTFFVGSVYAQRTTTKRPVKRPATTKTNTKLPPLEVRAARVKVSNQLFNVNQFVAVFGPIAQSIEALDKESRTRKISKKSVDDNETNKQKVIAAIRNLRAGLVTLETEFRTKPDLRIYLIKIQGISDLSARSEDLALAGKFVASRDPLRTVAQKLNDTLAVMPTAEL